MFPPALSPHTYHNARYTMMFGEAFCTFPAWMNRIRLHLCDRSHMKGEGDPRTAPGRLQEGLRKIPGGSGRVPRSRPGDPRRPQKAPGVSRKAPSEEQKDLGSVSDG